MPANTKGSIGTIQHRPSLTSKLGSICTSASQGRKAKRPVGKREGKNRFELFHVEHYWSIRESRVKAPKESLWPYVLKGHEWHLTPSRAMVQCVARQAGSTFLTRVCAHARVVTWRGQGRERGHPPGRAVPRVSSPAELNSNFSWKFFGRCWWARTCNLYRRVFLSGCGVRRRACPGRYFRVGQAYKRRCEVGGGPSNW